MNLKLLLASLLLSATCFAEPTLTAKDISKMPMPGRGKLDQCAKYAFCLNYTLFQKGIESKMLGYDVSAKLGHAIVLFQVSGQWYLIDNEFHRATKVAGDTDLARVRSWDRSAKAVRSVNFGSNPGATQAGYFAELAKIKD